MPGIARQIIKAFQRDVISGTETRDKLGELFQAERIKWMPSQHLMTLYTSRAPVPRSFKVRSIKCRSRPCAISRDECGLGISCCSAELQPVVRRALSRTSIGLCNSYCVAVDGRKRRTNAWCSGLARPCWTTVSRVARSPRSRAAGSSHSPGKTSLRTRP
jgi:hypothetical protein